MTQLDIDLEALFEFIADNPPSLAILGGIFLIVLSVLTATFDPSTTQFLRNAGILIFAIGILLQILYLYLKYR